jgi:hypothetical protein
MTPFRQAAVDLEAYMASGRKNTDSGEPQHGEKNMHAYDQVPHDFWETSGRGETGWNEERWQRWNDDLVEDFSRWLARTAKTCAVLGCMAVAGVMAFWIWSTL